MWVDFTNVRSLRWPTPLVEAIRDLLLHRFLFSTPCKWDRKSNRIELTSEKYKYKNTNYKMEIPFPHFAESLEFNRPNMIEFVTRIMVISNKAKHVRCSYFFSSAASIQSAHDSHKSSSTKRCQVAIVQCWMLTQRICSKKTTIGRSVWHRTVTHSDNCDEKQKRLNWIEKTGIQQWLTTKDIPNNTNTHTQLNCEREKCEQNTWIEYVTNWRARNCNRLDNEIPVNCSALWIR